MRGARARQCAGPLVVEAGDALPAEVQGGRAADGATGGAVGAVAGGRAQELCQVRGIGLEHPRLADRLEVVDAPSGHRAALRADAPAGLRRAELVGRAAGGVDDGQAAGHRLEHRHGEALATVGMHEHVARAVERGHLRVGEIGVEVDDRARLRGGMDGAAVGAAVDAVGAEVLDHQLHVVAAGEGLLPGGEQDVDAFAGDGATDEEEAHGGGAVQRVGLAVGSEALEVDAVGHDVDAVLHQAGVEVHAAHELAGHPELVDVALQRLEPVGGDRAELPGLDDGQAARARRAQVGRPLVADLDVGRVGQRAVNRRARPVQALDPVQARGDLVVDVRQARVQAVVALPGDGGRGGVEGAARRALASVVGLELVDVGGERARRLDPGLQALQQARLGGQAIELAREVARVERVEEQAVDLVDDGLAEAAEAGTTRGRGRPGTRRPSAGRSPTTWRACGDVDAGQQLRQRRGAERAAQLDHAAPVGGAQARGEALVDLAVHEHAQVLLGALGRLHQQLRALVRVGGAEEGDGQALAGAAGQPIAPERSHVSSAAGTAWRTTSIISRG